MTGISGGQFCLLILSFCFLNLRSVSSTLNQIFFFYPESFKFEISFHYKGSTYCFLKRYTNYTLQVTVVFYILL